MKYSALLVIPLVFLASQTLHAQQQTSAPASSPAPAVTAAPAPVSPAVTSMTPRQLAILHADIMMARKEFEEAIKAYEEVLVATPHDSEILNKVGVAYQQLDQLNHAEHYYKSSIKADKTYMSAVNNIGTVEYEKKHYSKAISYYIKASKLRGDMSTVYSNLGYGYFADKEYPEAMNAFQKALQLDPDIFIRRGGYGTTIQQRTSTDPGLFYYFVAKTYAGAGDAEEAAHFLKLARDDGYTGFLSAQTDPAFAKVIKDPRVQEVLVVPPSYARDRKPAMQN
ncbi:MAG: tetratricopeptide repeat protein [Candidatus Acidiferrales bacterium]